MRNRDKDIIVVAAIKSAFSRVKTYTNFIFFFIRLFQLDDVFVLSANLIISDKFISVFRFIRSVATGHTSISNVILVVLTQITV